MEVIKVLIETLNHGITPLIPLRGSTSASGHLSPLSYLGGLLEGNPDVFVQVRPKDADAEIQVVSAADALHLVGISPLTFRAKEALGVMNGTAPSAAAAALTIYDANNLAVLTQILTAMATEALLGSVDNYHDFISPCRPHPGQMEVATNIRSFLEGSQPSQSMNVKQQGLDQDRYTLRTAPQLIGPVFEDFLLANRQITTELNSSADNPLIDVDGDCFHHGGNFQAASVISAVEKTKTGLMMLGRLLTSHCQELINPTLNKGLPPDLCFDDSSLSFTCKGIDINMSSYLSDLAFLSNSAVSHVQVAEMNNQSVNSSALIAARYVAQSADIVPMMCASQLYVLCQALDLRASDREFFNAAKPELSSLYSQTWTMNTTNNDTLDRFDEIWAVIMESWHTHNQSDIEARYEEVAADSAHQIFEDLMISAPTSSSYKLIPTWKRTIASLLAKLHDQTRQSFLLLSSTPQYLALSTNQIYLWVRKTLEIPLHQELVDHPGVLTNDRSKRTIGTNMTRICTAIKAGQLIWPLQAATQKP